MLFILAALVCALPALAAPSGGSPIKPNRTILFHCMFRSRLTLAHNDYLRSTPVFDAIDNNVHSVESDLWWDKDAEKFYVAHTAVTIDHSKTFQTVTLDRVMSVLNGSHSGSAYNAGSAQKFLNAAKGKETSDPDWYSYYANGFGGVRPIQVLVEIKSKDGETSWPHVVDAFEPFRSKGWLTRYENGKIHYGPLIVVGTGGTPFDQIAPRTKRDVFWDCSLNSISSTTDIDGTKYHFNSTVCPMSSASYIDVAPPYVGLTPPSDNQAKKFRKDIVDAHKIKTTTRFYGVVDWPASAKYNDFNMLVEQGSDWLNLDDMSDAAKYTP